MSAIDDYLRDNRERFTREALTRQLRASGHDDAAIEAAWRRIEGSSPEAGAVVPPAPSDRADGGGMPDARPRGTAAVVIIVLGYGAAILAALVAMAAGGAVTVLMVVYAVAMLVAAVWSVRRIRRSPSAGEATVSVGAAFALALVIFIGLSGTCAALLGQAFRVNNGGL